MSHFPSELKNRWLRAINSFSSLFNSKALLYSLSIGVISKSKESLLREQTFSSWNRHQFRGGLMYKKAKRKLQNLPTHLRNGGKYTLFIPLKSCCLFLRLRLFPKIPLAYDLAEILLFTLLQYLTYIDI